ncbi:unnamed protein product [Rangifer tarandus platyrhynchus]|uniref:Uncharacterized protein n=1 Tax=Rangifer tarandus platyrhynchus TaxID=3082113 RepID=A0ABN8XKG4_RANTA|nr:unnamed protein product [Rangifer tarandus platyrhynchus]
MFILSRHAVRASFVKLRAVAETTAPPGRLHFTGVRKPLSHRITGSSQHKPQQGCDEIVGTLRHELTYTDYNTLEDENTVALRRNCIRSLRLLKRLCIKREKKTALLPQAATAVAVTQSRATRSGTRIHVGSNPHRQQRTSEGIRTPQSVRNTMFMNKYIAGLGRCVDVHMLLHAHRNVARRQDYN